MKELAANLLESLLSRFRRHSAGARLPKEPSAFFARAKASGMDTNLAYSHWLRNKENIS